MMKTQLCLFIAILSSIIGCSQDPKDRIFSSAPPDFQFQVLYARDGNSASYSKKEYVQLDKIVRGQFTSNTKGKYILNIDKDFYFTINSLTVLDPATDANGHKVNFIQSENCKNETTGATVGFLLNKYSNEDFYHISLLDKKYNHVYEYVIKIDQFGSNSSTTKDLNLGKPSSIHVFRDVSQMSFNEETGMWGEIVQTSNSVEIKKFVSNTSDGIFQINKYLIGKTNPVLSLNFIFQKRDKAGNYIYTCHSGNLDSDELDNNTLESISLQSSEDLNDMVTGKDGYLTTIILRGGINCLICED